MTFTEQITLLRDANGNKWRLAMSNVDIVLSRLPADEREDIRKVLTAVCVVHWFDEKIIAWLLQTSAVQAAKYFIRLRELTIVEPYLARGQGIANVHSEVRSIILTEMFDGSLDRLRLLSVRAIMYFVHEIGFSIMTDGGADGSNLSSSLELPHNTVLRFDVSAINVRGFEKGNTENIIEMFYNMFLAEPQQGVSLCDKIYDTFYSETNYQGLLALADVISELLAIKNYHAVTRKIKGYLLVILARIRYSYPRLDDNTSDLLPLLKTAIKHLRSESPSADITPIHELLGDILIALGQREEGCKEYDAVFEIRRSQIPINTPNYDEANWLSTAYNKHGLALEYRNNLAGAADAFRVALSIRERISELYPQNYDILRGIYMSEGYLASVLETQGEYEEAFQHIGIVIKIASKLVSLESTNLRWLSDLGTAHDSLGMLALKQGKGNAALDAFRSALDIRKKVVEHQPTNFLWQVDLALASGRLAMLWIQIPLFEDKSEARSLLAQGLTIMNTIAANRRLDQHQQEVMDWLKRWGLRIGLGGSAEH